MVLRDTQKAIALAMVVVGVYLVISSRSTLWDRDEPRFARATVEMVDSGNYLYPTFNGVLRPDKPILIYWLMSIPVRLLGPTELACRFFGAVGSGVTCFMTFLIGRRLFGPRVALRAMAILGTSFMMMFIGTAATADAVLLPCMMAAMAAFVASWGRGMGWKETLLLGLALGAALLAKGPVGLLPCVVIAVTLWLARGEQPVARRVLVPVLGAMAVAVMLFLAWAIPANEATGGEFGRIGLGKHVVGRSLAPMESHGGKWLLHLPYYAFVVIAFFFPWSMHLPGALSALAGKRIGGRFDRALLWGWMVPVFVIMTVVATKLPHYVLFTWPVMALLVAETLRLAEQGKLAERDTLWLRRGTWFFGPVAFGMAGVLTASGWVLKVAVLKWAGPLAGAALAVTAVMAIRHQQANRFMASSKALFTGIILLITFLLWILPALEQIKVSPSLAKAIRTAASPRVPLAVYQYGEPTLNFYTGRHIEALSEEKDVLEWAARPGPGILVIPRDRLEAVEQQHGSLSLNVVGSVKGYNYSKGKPLEVLALKRGVDVP